MCVEHRKSQSAERGAEYHLVGVSPAVIIWVHGKLSGVVQLTDLNVELNVDLLLKIRGSSSERCNHSSLARNFNNIYQQLIMLSITKLG